jgi:hypothetical protein
MGANLSDVYGRKETEMQKTKTCPNCGTDAENALILGDADACLEGLLECGCGADFTERAAHDGFAAAYYHPRLGINLFRATEMHKYVSVPGADLI